MGLIATILGGALKESFVPFTQELVERGRRVLAQNRGGLGFQGGANLKNDDYKTTFGSSPCALGFAAHYGFKPVACNVARGEDSAVLSRFLALSHKAEAHFNALRQRDLHAPGHARRILLLAGIHGNEPVAAALEEALELGAYGSDYLRNILDHRRSQPAQRGAELLFQVISIQPGQIAPLSDRPPHTSTVQAKA